MKEIPWKPFSLKLSTCQFLCGGPKIQGFLIAGFVSFYFSLSLILEILVRILPNYLQSMKYHKIISEPTISEAYNKSSSRAQSQMKFHKALWQLSFVMKFIQSQGFMVFYSHELQLRVKAKHITPSDIYFLFKITFIFYNFNHVYINVSSSRYVH